MFHTNFSIITAPEFLNSKVNSSMRVLLPGFLLGVLAPAPYRLIAVHGARKVLKCYSDACYDRGIKVYRFLAKMLSDRRGSLTQNRRKINK